MQKWAWFFPFFLFLSCFLDVLVTPPLSFYCIGVCVCVLQTHAPLPARSQRMLHLAGRACPLLIRRCWFVFFPN
ncbi:hypothetical protein BKA57DRAFT_473759 [Linnemannia elongata]|nr:hypothetical protein BKA57DRAFT_473759 [Linnemannia elongata]